MALFDAFAIVDWSAANTPTTGKDSIWIALGEREEGAFRLIETVNPPTRSAAMARLRQFFRDALAADKRVFAGFDFPFGYPRGAAGAIAGYVRESSSITTSSIPLHRGDPRGSESPSDCDCCRG